MSHMRIHDIMIHQRNEDGEHERGVLRMRTEK